MEILLLPMLVFIFVVVVIILYNRLSNYKKRADKSWKSFQVQLKKQQDSPDINTHSSDTALENARLDYNKKAAAYNRLIQTFPMSFMAAMAGDYAKEIM